MRTIETIVRQFPHLTGTEVLAIQAEDKLQDEADFKNENQEKIDFIEDINTNGGYYRGRFGIDQHSFYRVFNMILDNGKIYMDIEKIILFYNDSDDTHQVTRPNEIDLKRRIDSYVACDSYGLNNRDRVTVKEWDEVNDYLNNINQFWSTIKKIDG